ncbi:hypothetical protein C8R45DRAFT_1014952 [Mycena sanguinolenta]|nr:hypothetical protein C8R45DRAFT_1014952 [Mycena sanguinolenta]
MDYNNVHSSIEQRGTGLERIDRGAETYSTHQVRFVFGIYTTPRRRTSLGGYWIGLFLDPLSLRGVTGSNRAQIAHARRAGRSGGRRVSGQRWTVDGGWHGTHMRLTTPVLFAIDINAIRYHDLAKLRLCYVATGSASSMACSVFKSTTTDSGQGRKKGHEHGHSERGD